MPNLFFRLLAVVFLGLPLLPRASAATVTVNSQANGPTPFIKTISLTVSPPASLAHIDFKIYPKPGSETRPVYVRYSAARLQTLGDYNTTSGVVTLPVFGLYENYNNRVALVTTFTDQTSQRNAVQMQTLAWTDPANIYKTPAVNLARVPNSNLSYDFMLLRHTAANNTPVIIDTDGQVRWAGTANTASQSAILFSDAIYVYSGSSTILKMRVMDGTVSTVVDLGSQGVVGFHHNFDYAKTGIFISTNTSNASDPNLNQTESTVFEIAANGAILHRWNYAKTFRDAMIAGGDDPTNFVRNRGQSSEDWFHNNSNTYRASDNTLIASSRENFIVGMDYDTGALKWIMGDTTKQWYVQYPSLRAYAITVDQSIVNMGQHAVHCRRDLVTCFNNGEASYAHTPAGADRNFSMPNKFIVDTTAKTGTLVWSYRPTPTMDSNICGSFYEDGSGSDLVDYATITALIGLDANSNKVFDFRYPNVGSCSTIYNAIPIHLENMRFN